MRVVNGGNLANEVLESRLESQPGDPVDPTRFAQDAEAIYGLLTFEQVSYRLVDEGGQTGLEFEGRAKSWGPNYLLFGLSLEDDFEGQNCVQRVGEADPDGHQFARCRVAQ